MTLAQATAPIATAAALATPDLIRGSGQRGNPEVRAHRASQNIRAETASAREDGRLRPYAFAGLCCERAGDTRPEPGSSSRVDFERYRLRTFVDGLNAQELEHRTGTTKLTEIAQALEANPKAVLFDSAGGHPLIGNVLAGRTRFAQTPSWDQRNTGISAAALWFADLDSVHGQVKARPQYVH